MRWRIAAAFVLSGPPTHRFEGLRVEVRRRRYVSSARPWVITSRLARSRHDRATAVAVEPNRSSHRDRRSSPPTMAEMMFDRYITVDWSASSRPQSGRDSIWICVLDASDGPFTINPTPGPAPRCSSAISSSSQWPAAGGHWSAATFPTATRPALRRRFSSVSRLGCRCGTISTSTYEMALTTVTTGRRRL